MSALDGWQLGLHAVDRALDMAVDASEIRAALMTPDVRQPTGPDYPDHQQLWAKGRIALVVDPAARYVVTVLWRGVTYERGTDSEPFRDN